MTEYSSPERLVQAVLLPWVEEMQTKFADHDALRQAEQVVAALREAGYMRPAPPTAEDALAGLVEAIEELRTKVDEAPTHVSRTRLGIELIEALKRFEQRNDFTPEMRKYTNLQREHVLIEVFDVPAHIVAEHSRSNPDQ